MSDAQVPTTAEEATKLAEAQNEESDLMPNEELSAADGTGAKLEKVTVKSGEEDEEEKFKGKCKAYRFDEGENEWKERAVGEMRLLKNSEGRARMVLRQDVILKIRVCINLKECGPLRVHSGSDKAWVFTGMDYSEEVDSTRETICLKFANKDEAKKFNDEFIALGGPK